MGPKGLISVNPSENGNDCEYLHRIIQCLRDELLAERAKTEELKNQLRIEGMVEHKFVTAALEQARIDVALWKDKAQTAEKRLKVFEKFAARLRGIRDAAAYYDGSGSADSEMDEKNKENGREGCAASLIRVRFVESDGGQDEKEKSLDTQNCSCDDTGIDHGDRRGTPDQMDRRSVVSNVSATTHSRGASLDEVADLWMAAKEILDMDFESEE
ncbi:hypothetical protein K4F52_005322 [Lecanicillium sp. MT-2017a]|nr:hypothetical protein K4F52_005322 [Lecanicillium sp. MT-2017a]